MKDGRIVTRWNAKINPIKSWSPLFSELLCTTRRWRTWNGSGGWTREPRQSAEPPGSRCKGGLEARSWEVEGFQGHLWSGGSQAKGSEVAAGREAGLVPRLRWHTCSCNLNRGILEAQNPPRFALRDPQDIDYSSWEWHESSNRDSSRCEFMLQIKPGKVTMIKKAYIIEYLGEQKNQKRQETNEKTRKKDLINCLVTIVIIKGL